MDQVSGSGPVEMYDTVKMQLLSQICNDEGQEREGDEDECNRAT